MTSSKTTKRALVASACATLICIAMLIGTTFAWFTDTASTSVNKIQAGTLDVSLQMNKGTAESPEWVSAEGETLQFKKAADGASQEVLWEPGCTYELPQLKVVNNGNLALKYKVLFNAVDTTEENLELAKVLDVTMNGNSVGTLYDVLTSTDEDGYAHGNLTASGTEGADSGALTLSVTMQTSAGNEYQGLSIGGIAVTVVATQDTVEYDSTTNQYDKDAEYPVQVTTANELTTALAEGKSAVLTQDLTVSSSITIPAGADTTLETNGNTLTCTAQYGAFDLEDGANLTVSGGGEIKVSYEDNQAQRVFNVSDKDSTLTISDVTVTTDNGFIGVSEGTVIINGGTYNITNGGAAVFAYGENSKVIINGGVFTGQDESEGAVYAFNEATVEVNGGTFNFKDEDSCNWTLCDYSQMTSYSFSYNGVSVTAGGHISVTGGTFNKNVSKLPNYKYDSGFSVVEINYVASGYKVQETTIDGATWYKVVEE